MRLIDADKIEYTHTVARSLDDGHNWNELCVTKDEIDDMPTVETERIGILQRCQPVGIGIMRWKCSECGEVYEKPVNYCSHCGFKLIRQR